MAYPATVGATPPTIRFTRTPPAASEIATPVSIAWTCAESNVEYRYKLDVPGDWLGGIAYAYQKWTAWGTWQATITYSDFIVEGNYKFTLEARKRGATNSSQISAPFRMFFVSPTISEEPLQIDWTKVRGARKLSDKFQFLADSYRVHYDNWMKVYNLELKVLKLTGSPQLFQETIARQVVGKGAALLREWADKSIAATVSKVLLPKTLYDIVKAVGLDAVLIYRNYKVNRAAFTAVTAYWAWTGYEQLAKEARAAGK